MSPAHARTASTSARCFARGFLRPSRNTPDAGQFPAGIQTALKRRWLRIDRSAALDVEAAARQKLHGNGVVHGTGGCQAQLLDAEASRARQDAQRVHVRVLALRGSHSDRAVALEQFARIKPLLRRVLQILDLQVLVVIDEVLGARMCR